MPQKRINMAEMIAREIISQRTQLARRIAAEAGPPTNSEPVSEQRQLEMWMEEDESVDPQVEIPKAFLQAKQGGKDDEEAMEIARETVAAMRFPKRWALIQGEGRVDDESRVAYANSMARKALKWREEHENKALDALEDIDSFEMADEPDPPILPPEPAQEVAPVAEVGGMMPARPTDDALAQLTEAPPVTDEAYRGTNGAGY